MIPKMTADELIRKLENEIYELREKYCEGCQEWDCDNCWADADGEEE